MPIAPVWALEEEMLTMRPQCAAFMSPITACAQSIGPRTLTA